MKIDKMSKKMFEEYQKQELNRQEAITEIMKPTNPYNTQFERAYEFIEGFTQQINRATLAENMVLIEKLHATDKLLTDLYEEIN